MTFLFDNNFSPRLVEILRALDVDGRALRETFPKDIKDVDLFPKLRGSSWIFVTADMRIQRTPVEIQALKECGVSAIFFRKFFLRHDKWEQAYWLTKHWRSVQGHALGLTPPVYLEVESNGRVSRKQL